MSRQHNVPTAHSLPATRIWIVAADSSEARIFQAQYQDGQMTELPALTNADARLTTQEAVSDRAGHMGGGRHGTSHSFEPRQTHGEHVSEVFAKRLAEHLAAAQQQGAVERIYLLADPRFLGLLRQHITPALKGVIAQELSLDVVHHSPAEIRKALPVQL